MHFNLNSNFIYNSHLHLSPSAKLAHRASPTTYTLLNSPKLNGAITALWKAVGRLLMYLMLTVFLMFAAQSQHVSSYHVQIWSFLHPCRWLQRGKVVVISLWSIAKNLLTLNSACKQTGVKNEETKKHTKPGRSPILHDGTSSYAKIVVKN